MFAPEPELATSGDPAPDVAALWTPIEGPQLLAYCSPADELFYGGGGGGGKSDLALGLAITQHRSSVIFRREFTQFRGPQGLIERSRQVIGLQGNYNGSTFTWRNLPGGRSIEFGGMKTESDKFKWKGRPHDLKAFDELPEFSETQYRFVLAWLRSTYPGQRTRVVGTGNPPTTAEGMWVIRYWGPWLDDRHPNPAKAGELRYFIVDAKGLDQEVPSADPVEVNGKLVQPRSRTFIPASLEDNPHLRETGYADVLDNLPEPLRSQMRRGDFAATQADDAWQVIPTAWVRLAQQRWMQMPSPVGQRPLSALGVDPSRGGPDRFCMAKRYDNWFGPVIRHEGREAPDGDAGAALVMLALGRGQETEHTDILIDVIGSAGSSVYDTARKMKLGNRPLRVIALNGSEASTARDKSGKLGFVNKRAQWHWQLREALDPTSGQEIALPPDPELLADLTAPRWRPTPRGIQVELKEDIKKRIGRSPDAGESVIYASAQATSAGGFFDYARKQYEAAQAAKQPTAGGGE